MGTDYSEYENTAWLDYYNADVQIFALKTESGRLRVRIGPSGADDATGRELWKAIQDAMTSYFMNGETEHDAKCE